MWGAVISAALAAAGSIAGNVAKNKSIDSQSGKIDKRLKENENWYNRRYNEDSTQRADAQRLLTLTEDAIKRRNKAAAGRSAVMGATEESIAAEKEANNDAYANVVGQIAAAGEQRKERIEQQYLNRKENYENEKMKLESQRALGGDYASGIFGGIASGIGNASSVDDFLDGFKKKGTGVPNQNANNVSTDTKAKYTTRRDRRF